MSIVAMENIRGIPAPDARHNLLATQTQSFINNLSNEKIETSKLSKVLKNKFRISDLNTFYHVFKNWRKFVEHKYIIKVKGIAQGELDCNLLNHTKANGQLKKDIIQFQKKYNHLLCLLKFAFNAMRNNWIVETKDKEWQTSHNKHNYYKPFIYPMAKIDVHNKQEFIISKIAIADDDKYIYTKCGMIFNAKLISESFQPNYARTIDSYQGDKIEIPFCIVGLENQFMIRERLYSAFGRSINKDLIHIDYYNKNRIYKRKQYPDEIIVDVTPNREQKKVSFYGVWYRDELMYIGSTAQKIEDRMSQHFDSLENDMFHEWLRATPKEEIILDIVDNNKDLLFDSWADIEDFEMELVQKFNPKLNTRRKTCRQELFDKGEFIKTQKNDD
jgi:hypothetical protein